MKVHLFGEDILVSQIIAQARKGGCIAEHLGPQFAIFRVINGEMTCDAGAAAIADEHELVSRIVSFACSAPEQIESLAQLNRIFRAISDFGVADEAG